MKLIKDLGIVGIDQRRWGLYECGFCGSQKEFRTSNIKSGHTKGCGCRRHPKKHGLAKHQLYGTWLNIKNRCANSKIKSYKNYGGRGIRVCDRWLNSFENFLEDMGERPEGMSLDRIDNNGPYSPDNCRWATKLQQNSNHRGNVKLLAYGLEQTVTAWAKTLEIPVDRLYSRLRLGWSHHDALFTPKGGKRG